MPTILLFAVTVPPEIVTELEAIIPYASPVAVTSPLVMVMLSPVMPVLVSPVAVTLTLPPDILMSAADMPLLRYPSAVTVTAPSVMVMPFFADMPQQAISWAEAVTEPPLMVRLPSARIAKSIASRVAVTPSRVRLPPYAAMP